MRREWLALAHALNEYAALFWPCIGNSTDKARIFAAFDAGHFVDFENVVHLIAFLWFFQWHGLRHYLNVEIDCVQFRAHRFDGRENRFHVCPCHDFDVNRCRFPSFPCQFHRRLSSLRCAHSLPLPYSY